MPQQRGGSFERRLAVVAFIDVVGYSALMSQDEDDTLARWTALRRDIVEARLRSHRGHLVKLTGDGALVEFASVLDAVAWSRDVQAAVEAADLAAGEHANPIALRVAVHLCDVIEDGTDLYGDGVNVAARLQEHAPPGGIIVSEAVYDIARVSIDLEAESIGALNLKNIATPVRAYLIAGATGRGVRVLPAKAVLPSIAVLPLQTMSADPSDSYFGDGIVEDIIVSLAGLRELLVISRASTLAYGSQRADPRDVGRTLGVRYVLMGSVRRSADKVRVAIELCDAISGACLWAERYVASLGDIFDVQDEIVGRIVAGIAPSVRTSELRQAMRKKPRSFTAYDHFLRGLEGLHSLDRDTFTRAREHLEEAAAADPDFAMPRAWLARWYSLWVGQGWSEAPEADAEQAVRCAAEAIELDRQNALALATFGHLRSFLFHDYERAQIYLGRARDNCPNSSIAWSLSSATMSYLARCEEAIEFAERGLRLSPYDRSLYLGYFFLALAHYGCGKWQEALKWCELSRAENPKYTANLRILAAAAAGCGDGKRAQEAAAAVMAVEPGFSLTHYAAKRQPFADAVIGARLVEQLAAAGLPA